MKLLHILFPAYAGMTKFESFQDYIDGTASRCLQHDFTLLIELDTGCITKQPCSGE